MNYLYILWGFLILAGLGLVFGVILTVAAIFFAVEEDPRIGAVEKMLPNANCGACGYAGCHALAEALVKGEVSKVSVCKVGKGDKNFQPILDYLSSHPDKDGKTPHPTL
jgi:electron transport complex protein RnfB